MLSIALRYLFTASTTLLLSRRRTTSMFACLYPVISTLLSPSLQPPPPSVPPPPSPTLAYPILRIAPGSTLQVLHAPCGPTARRGRNGILANRGGPGDVRVSVVDVVHIALGKCPSAYPCLHVYAGAGGKNPNHMTCEPLTMAWMDVFVYVCVWNGCGVLSLALCVCAVCVVCVFVCVCICACVYAGSTILRSGSAARLARIA